MLITWLLAALILVSVVPAYRLEGPAYYDTRARAHSISYANFDPIGFFSFALGGDEIVQKIIAII